MKKISLFCMILLCGILFINKSSAQSESNTQQKLVVQIELTPFLNKHQNPYFALWLSNKNKEHKALVVLREKVKWLRDLKKFWRNVAREKRSESDAVTGATNKSKKFSYAFEVEAKWQNISLEVVRENGFRELIYLPISSSKECNKGKVEIVRLCAQLVLLD